MDLKEILTLFTAAKKMIKNLLIILLLLTTKGYSQFVNYGISAGLNYSLMGLKIEDLTGRGLYSIGAFISRPVSRYHNNKFLNMLDVLFEPSVNFISFREVQSDARYTNNYLDANFSVYFIPERMNNDIKFFLGLRPSVLLNNQSEIIDFGVYRPKINDPLNFNRNGDVDFCLNSGICFSLGDVVQAEFKYIHAFTNNNKPNYIKGRPSVFEFGLRISATDIKNKISGLEESTSKKIKRLKQGYLLVMLTTFDNKEKKAMQAYSTEQDMQTSMVALANANKNIIQAFKQAYQFSKVLFFMDSSAYKISNGIFKDVFVNEHYEIINHYDFDTTNYFIASFSEDVSAFTQKVDYGLHIFDKNFVALPKPFLSAENYFGVNFGGDPLNYFRKVKFYYMPADYLKIVKRFNNRMLKISLLTR